MCAQHGRMPVAELRRGADVRARSLWRRRRVAAAETMPVDENALFCTEKQLLDRFELIERNKVGGEQRVAGSGSAGARR